MTKDTSIRRTLAIALAAALVASAAVPAAAQTFRAPQQVNHIMGASASDSHVDLGLVRSSTDAVVEVRSYHAGIIGDLLGTSKVHAGANTGVKIQLDRPTRTGFMVLIKDGNKVLAQSAVGRAD